MEFYTLGLALDVNTANNARDTLNHFHWDDSRAQKRIEADANCAVDRIKRAAKAFRAIFFSIVNFRKYFFKWLQPNWEALINSQFYYLFSVLVKWISKMRQFSLYHEGEVIISRSISWLNNFIAPDIQTTLMRWLSAWLA